MCINGEKMKFLLLVFASLFLVGCEKQEIKTYNVPKEINALIDTKNKDLEKPSVIIRNILHPFQMDG